MFNSNNNNHNNINLVNMFDCWVFDNFTYNAAIAAANNEHIFRIRMTAKRQKRDHFLIGEFILLSALNNTVQYQGSAMSFPVIPI